MNPENRGQHIGLHHSYLWRKSMFVNDDGAKNNSCHKQLNQLGHSGQCWKARNSQIITNISGIKNKSTSQIRSKNQDELDCLLAEQKKFTDSKKSMLRSISPDRKCIQRSDALMEGIKKMRDMDLLQRKEMNHCKYPGSICEGHIYNDYHDRKANPGYSRNHQGKIFTT